MNGLRTTIWGNGLRIYGGMDCVLPHMNGLLYKCKSIDVGPARIAF